MRDDVYCHFRAAAVQAAPVFLDREATIAKLEGWVAKAKVAGADLVSSASPIYLLTLFGTCYTRRSTNTPSTDNYSTTRSKCPARMTLSWLTSPAGTR